MHLACMNRCDKISTIGTLRTLFLKSYLFVSDFLCIRTNGKVIAIACLPARA